GKPDNFEKIFMENINKKSTEDLDYILKFTAEKVLKPLQVYKDQIYSFPLNVPSMFQSVQGYSGTIDEIFIFPHNIIWSENSLVSKENVHYDKGSSGWVMQCLLNGDPQIVPVEFES